MGLRRLTQTLQDKIDAMKHDLIECKIGYCDVNHTLNGVNKAIQELREEIKSTLRPVRYEEQDQFFVGYHRAIRDVLALIGEPKK